MKCAARIFLVLLFAALGAKFPAIQDPSFGFSVVGAAILGSMAILALFLGNFISKRQENRVIPSKLQSILLTVSLACLLLALSSVTMLLYTNIGIFKYALFVFVFVGAITVFIATLITRFKK